MVVGRLVEMGGVTGAGVLGYGHCGSMVLYCAMERSQNLMGKETVVGV